MNVRREKTKKPLYAAFIIFLLFAFQQLASKAGAFIANAFPFNSIDADGVFAWISVHHIIQMALALIVILLLARICKLNFHFSMGNKKIGFKYLFVFTVIIFVYVITNYLLGYAFNQISLYPYPLNARNIIGSLGFQLLLSGTAEEILFRALPITLLVFLFGKSKLIKIWKWHISLETIIAAFLFSLAHIAWSIQPLSISINWFQLFYAFILGLAYGTAYQKSKSIVYPMTMHSISNILMVGSGYLFALV